MTERPPLRTQAKTTWGAGGGHRGAPAGSVAGGGGVAEELAGPEADVHEADEDGDLDQRADDAGEGLAGGHAEDADGDGDGELEVVAGGGEDDGGGAR